MRTGYRPLLFFGLLVPCSALGARNVKDWQVLHPNAGTCLAVDHAGAIAGIGVGVIDKSFMLMAWAPELPTPPGDHDGTLSFEGKPDIPIDAFGYKDQLIISFERGAQAYAITHSAAVTITANGHSHRYSLKGLAAAADNVARCAGVPPLSTRPK